MDISITQLRPTKTKGGCLRKLLHLSLSFDFKSKSLGIHGLIRKVMITSKFGAWSPKPLVMNSWTVVNGSLDRIGLFKKGQRSDFFYLKTSVLKEQDFLKFIKLEVSRLLFLFPPLFPLSPVIQLSKLRSVCSRLCWNWSTSHITCREPH